MESRGILGPASAVVRALAAAVERQAEGMPSRWTGDVPCLAAAEARLAAGIAALEGDPLLTGPALLEIARAIGAMVEAVDSGLGDAMLTVVARLATLDRRGLDELAKGALVGAWDVAPPIASRLDLDPYALVSVVDYAARPALLAAGRRVGHLVPAIERISPHCLVCGSSPVLAELSGKDGARWLRCARCGGCWSYLRLGCVWCGEQDGRELFALHGEGDAGVRQADCCKRCQGYLEAIAVLDPLDYVKLLEVDLETARLDLAAVDRGYTRGSFPSGTEPGSRWDA